MLLLNLTPLRFSSLRFLKLNFQSRSIDTVHIQPKRRNTSTFTFDRKKLLSKLMAPIWRSQSLQKERRAKWSLHLDTDWNQDPIPLLCPVFPIISSFNAFPARDYTPVSTSTDATPPMPMDTARTGRRRAKLEVARVVVGGGGIGRRGGRTIRCLFPRLRAGQSN